MWPGSEVDLGQGLNPSAVDKFNQTEVLSKKMHRVLDWLDQPLDSRPELILSYVPNIDSVGHQYGIGSSELVTQLKYVDSFLEDLYLGLHERNLTELVNVVVVSDHGMSVTSNNRLIYLDDLIDVKMIEHFDGSPLFGLRPYSQHKVKDVWKKLKKSYKKHAMKDKFGIYLKEDILKSQFGGSDGPYNSRVAPIWIIPKIGYTVTTVDATDKQQQEGKIAFSPLGLHGYDNQEVLMRSLFLATGPYFEKQLGDKYKLKPFENTEVYNIICDSMGVTPVSTNATSLPSYIKQENLLPGDWKDEFSYPNVDFYVDILNETATVDTLWGEVDDDEDDDSDSDEEATPTTLSTVVTGLRTQTSSAPTSTSDSDSDDESDSDDDKDDFHKSDDDDDDDDDDNEDDDDDDEGAHKFSWSSFNDKIKGKVDEYANELEDLYDDVAEEIGDAYDGAKESFKDATGISC
ncbi:unnamed protein product [Ambrosiozyma monospora]|uniref:Unnamed protein product n=1 Tax=Ambrosiozyma monospora TaxID=43982 RepID=A0ACB5TPU3_AMBMO|nr:unnamed protein product [Ambrosiozyma monospora]